jgi:hypothetical protein
MELKPRLAGIPNPGAILRYFKMYKVLAARQSINALAAERSIAVFAQFENWFHLLLRVSNHKSG